MSFKNHKDIKEEQLKNLIYATYVNDMVLMLNGFSEGSSLCIYSSIGSLGKLSFRLPVYILKVCCRQEGVQ
jgi:hypothetical protein